MRSESQLINSIFLYTHFQKQNNNKFLLAVLDINHLHGANRISNQHGQLVISCLEYLWPPQPLTKLIRIDFASIGPIWGCRFCHSKCCWAALAGSKTQRQYSAGTRVGEVVLGSSRVSELTNIGLSDLLYTQTQSSSSFESVTPEKKEKDY